PGQQADHDEDGAQVEDGDAPDDAVGRLGDGAPGVLRLPGRQRGDLAAHEGEDDQQNAGEDGPGPVRQEAVVPGQVGAAGLLAVDPGQDAEHGEPADEDERGDRDDLD